MTKRLYLTGGWGYGNKGDNAILLAMLHTLNSENTPFDLHLVSFSPDEIRRMHNLNGFPSIHSLLVRRKRFYYFRRVAILIWQWTNDRFGKGIMLSFALKKHLKAIKAADIVIMGGGGYFNDAWEEALPARLLEIEFASAMGTPLMLYAQTVGPFSEKNSKTILRKALKDVAYIAYRDAQSKRTLELAGVPEKCMSLTADEANLILPIATKEDRNRYSFNSESRLIGVMVQNFRRHESPFGQSPQGQITENNVYYSQICDGLAKISAIDSVSFLLIPSTTWDENSCQHVMTELENRGILNVKILQDPDTDTFVRACQSVDVMISTNMHPIILATTAERPSIALSYHYKLDDFMESIGMAANVARIDAFTCTWIVERYSAITENIKTVQEKIRSSHANVRAMAQVNGQRLRNLLSRC
jgi:polysaccharide pyruvyl transferase WcaK-like protein